MQHKFSKVFISEKLATKRIFPIFKKSITLKIFRIPIRKGTSLLLKQGALLAILFALTAELRAADRVVQVVDLDVSKINQTIERPRSTGAASAVTIGGVRYERSLPTRAQSRLYIALDGRAKIFSALGGIDDSAETSTYSFRGVVGVVRFQVYGDGRLLQQSGLVKKGDPAAKLEASLAGVHELELAVDGPDGAYANWVNARIVYGAKMPKTIFAPEERAVNRVAVQPPQPRLNGAWVVGIRPGTPFLHVIAATGRRPLRFFAKGLPQGLKLDSQTGIISGAVARPGKFDVLVTAKNSLGEASKALCIKVGEQLALTPPMGWNSWNVTEGLVSETVLEEMADAMVSDGFRDVGYQYINIDDGYVVGRDSAGRPILDPVRFPHGLKAVADYLHARGLKLGVYSSPGATTCAGAPGTLGHEAGDVQTWVSWGVDLLKYDLCSTPPDRSRKLYILMGNLLEKSGRSIVYSLCGSPASWGDAAKAQLWRTAGDIRDAWHLNTGDGLIDCFDKQSEMVSDGPGKKSLADFQHVGGWDDPDLLVIGIYGKGASANDEGASGCNDIEYQTQMSLWALRSSPLLMSADLRIIRPSALKILTNPEVIDVDQDPLGRQPKLIFQGGGLASWSSADKSEADLSSYQKYEVWAKDMADGSKVLALLNRSEAPATITAKWAAAGLKGPQRVRDLWSRQDLGCQTNQFSSLVQPHGTILIRLWPAH